jgi:hypothetical protein
MVTENCVNLIREFTRYRWKTFANKRLHDTNNAQEQPVKKDDHALDSLRYFIMSRPDLTPDLPGVVSRPQNPLGLSVAYGEGMTVSPKSGIYVPKEQTVFRDPEFNTDWEYADDDMGAIW